MRFGGLSSLTNRSCVCLSDYQPPNAHGSRKALIVGINYKYSRYQLKGCLNDANCMKFMLTTKFDFPEASILMLTGGCN